ncbi:MAG: photosynthetic reaction center subunit H [Hyphomicrobium sp.]|nr:photosynthetic reaction center subunit H [Hyphomicrobium sp.]
MKLGQITSYIDVAQITLYVFLGFFVALMVYIRREDRREGYPLFSEPSNTYKSGDFFFIPPPKVFRLPHGGTASSPSGKVDSRDLRAAKVEPWPGAPLAPIGDPMLAAVGPGSYAERSNTADLTHEGVPKIVPLRVATNFYLETRDPDPRGLTVYGADGVVGGTVRDVWVDRSEVLIRYLEVEVAAGKSVLLPINFARVDGRRGRVAVKAIMGHHFAQVPALANANQVTLLEEDKIVAYYGGGTLYADPSRQEPLF